MLKCYIHLKTYAIIWLIPRRHQKTAERQNQNYGDWKKKIINQWHEYLKNSLRFGMYVKMRTFLDALGEITWVFHGTDSVINSIYII